MVKDAQSRLLPRNCLSVFDHFVGLAFNGLKPLKILVASTFIFLVFARDSSSAVWDSIVLTE